MPSLMQLGWGTATRRGAVRRVNEDSHLAEPPVFLVSDGMGGRAAGDVASAILAQEFRGRAGADAVGAEWVAECVARSARRIRRLAGAGATVAGLALTEHSGAAYWLAFNIGDSRIYRAADGALTQISVDHSYVQELVEAGEITSVEARAHPRRNVITRAVGVGAQAEPDCWLLPGVEGDRLVLCSDGVTAELADEVLGEILAANLDPQRAADAVVAAVVAAGGRDDATAVVIDVLAVASPRVDRAPTADRNTQRILLARAQPEAEQTRPQARGGSAGRQVPPPVSGLLGPPVSEPVQAAASLPQPPVPAC